MWDTRNGRVVHTFKGHKHEVSATQFNYSVSGIKNLKYQRNKLMI